MQITDSELQATLDRQHGLVTFEQLRPHGYSRKRIECMLDTGRWQRVLHGVYAASSGPLSRLMTLTAALLYGGPTALLSHRTAAEHWRMVEVDETAPIHLTVRYGLSAMNQPASTIVDRGHDIANPGAVLHPGVVVHRTRAHPYVAVPGDLPRTSRPDTVFDLAVAEPTPNAAFRTFIAAATNGQVRIPDLRRRLEERRPRRYVRVLSQAITTLADGVQSVLEYRYALDVEEAHGLLPGSRQQAVVVDGQTLYEDVAYALPDGSTLIVRLDGRTHILRHVAFRDRRRDNAAQLAGRHRLVYGWEEVDRDPCGVHSEVRQVLESAGWYAPNPCPRCARFSTLGGG